MELFCDFQITFVRRHRRRHSHRRWLTIVRYLIQKPEAFPLLAAILFVSATEYICHSIECIVRWMKTEEKKNILFST